MGQYCAGLRGGFWVKIWCKNGICPVILRPPGLSTHQFVAPAGSAKRRCIGFRGQKFPDFLPLGRIFGSQKREFAIGQLPYGPVLCGAGGWNLGQNLV